MGWELVVRRCCFEKAAFWKEEGSGTGNLGGRGFGKGERKGRKMREGADA